MKKFVSKVIWFLIGLVVLDVLVGLGARYLVGHAKGGDTGLNNYICHEMKDECIVFGSSRGMHHYDPNIIADSLGMSCWNCSLDGNGIILMYGRYKMLSARYTPKMLIYDVQTSFDLLENDNHKYLRNLRYYYDEPGVDSIFGGSTPWSGSRCCQTVIATITSGCNSYLTTFTLCGAMTRGISPWTRP